MEQNESISELLLSRLPQSANLAPYQKEVTSLLAENEKKLRRNKWTVVRVWVFVVVVSAPFLWMAGTHFNTAEGNWFLGLVGFWVLERRQPEDNRRITCVGQQVGKQEQ